MKAGDPVAVRSAAKALSPLAALLGVGATMSGVAGAGLAGGALIGLSITLHALVFGEAAARRAFGAFAWRALIACALGAGGAAVCAPDGTYAPLLGEAAAAGSVAAAIALAFTALAARAPTLRDEDW